MIILWFVLLLAALLFIAVFTKPVHVFFHLDSSEMDMRAWFKWLFVRAEADVIDYKVHLEVYLAGWRVFSDVLKKKGRQDRTTHMSTSAQYASKFNALDLHDTRVRMSYGFNEPQFTGIFCAAGCFIDTLLQDAEIEQYPDFLPDSEFLKIEAETNVNAGKTLLNMVQSKFHGERRRKNYGTIKFH
jgi:hypothetical protein